MSVIFTAGQLGIAAPSADRGQLRHLVERDVGMST